MVGLTQGWKGCREIGAPKTPSILLAYRAEQLILPAIGWMRIFLTSLLLGMDISTKLGSHVSRQIARIVSTATWHICLQGYAALLRVDPECWVGTDCLHEGRTGGWIARGCFDEPVDMLLT